MQHSNLKIKFINNTYYPHNLMKKNHEKIILYGLLAILVIVLVFSVINLFTSNESSNTAMIIDPINLNTEDKCKPPEGTDPEKWKEHMGHHPEQYEGCI